MSSLTPWLDGTIIGFVYLCAAFFLLLSCAKVHDLGFLTKIHSYAPYIAVLILFFSYVVGLAAHFVSQHIWITWFNHPEYAYHAPTQIAMTKDTPPDLLSSLGASYDTFVMFRHLILGFLFLGISLWFWFRKKAMPAVRWSLVVSCLLLSLFFAYTYHVERGLYLELLNTIKAMHGQ
jgi:heme A synthase